MMLYIYIYVDTDVVYVKFLSLSCCFGLGASRKVAELSALKETLLQTEAAAAGSLRVLAQFFGVRSPYKTAYIINVINSMGICCVTSRKQYHTIHIVL